MHATHLLPQAQSLLEHGTMGQLIMVVGAGRHPHQHARRVPPYPHRAMRHLARPVGAGGLPNPSACGVSGATRCGDAVEIDLEIRGGHVVDAGFRVFGCGAATAAASSACALVRGRPLIDALAVGVDAIDSDCGGFDSDRRHGAETAADALARALEHWYSARLGHISHPLMRERVVVAMSGGVDSAVAATLLAEAGYDVVGVTMRLWHDPAAAAAERSCCSPETVQVARQTAQRQGIPHVTLDVAESFRRGVVDAFIDGYRRGETPNPCVTCNGDVRFRILEQAAGALGARHLATGHYARVRGGVLAEAADRDKDQTYMLSRLPGTTLSRLVLPLGDFTKTEVREMARERRLGAADAVESQEVCFVGVGGYVPFLERNASLAAHPGPVVDVSGAVIGRHEGYWRFTVGQRRGIGIASDEPLYVLRTDATSNTVVVGPRSQLSTTRLSLESAVFHEVLDGSPVDVRVRYRGEPLRGVARTDAAGGVEIDLHEPASGVAHGQTAALYRQGRLVGAGTIRRTG